MSKTTRGRITTFKVPNHLVLDSSLSYSARRMGAVLYSRRNRFGTCRKSLVTLAALAECAVSTARTALEELISGGYITRSKHYRYDEKQGRLVYDQYTYHCNLGFHGGYTLIPRDLFHHSLKSSSFTLCLYLYYQAGNRKRSFPSLNRMCKDIGMGKSTVCRALKALEAVGLIFAQSCVKVNHAHSNNSYFFLTVCPAAVSVATNMPSVTLRVLCQLPVPHAYARWHTPKRIGLVPFPYLKYSPKSHQVQLILPPGGSIKIRKLR